MTDLAARLLEAIGERERIAQKIVDDMAVHSYADVSYDVRTPTADGYTVERVPVFTPATVLRECAAHRRIVQRYQQAVQLAEGDARARGPLQPYSETRVATLADVLGDLADAYGVYR